MQCFRNLAPCTSSISIASVLPVELAQDVLLATYLALSAILSVVNHILRLENADTYDNDICCCVFLRILAPFISSSDRECFSLAKTKRCLGLRLREGRLGTVGMIYNINKKSCRKRLLTYYLAPYRINYICGVRVVYPETVTYAHTPACTHKLLDDKKFSDFFLITCSRSDQPPREKPTVVHDYNQHMLDVDKLDQLCSYYSFLHKSVKWWRKVFFWLLEVAVVNSYVLYKQSCVQTNNRPLTHLAFRR